MAHKVKNAEVSCYQIQNASLRTDISTITLGWRDLKSHVQSEINSAVEDTRREKKSTLAEKTLCDVISTEYWAVTHSITDSSFSLLEIITVEMIHEAELDDPLTQNYR